MKVDSRRRKGSSIFIRILLIFMSINIITSGTLIVISYHFSRGSTEKRTKESISQQILAISENFGYQYRTSLKRTMKSLTSSSVLDDYLFSSYAERLILSKRIERLLLQTIQDFDNYHLTVRAFSKWFVRNGAKLSIHPRREAQQLQNPLL